MIKVNSQGFVPVIVLVAVLGLVAFVLVSGSGSFKSSKNASVYGKNEAFAKSPYQSGDANGDNKVDILDYNLIITNFSRFFDNGDFNGDGKVDILDYNTVISNFGKKYTAQATATPANVAMIEGVPVCTDHDPTKWHPLVKKDSSGKILCTYGHEHHDDPNSVNDIFGPVGAWWGANGQEISYPWQTFAGAGLGYPAVPTDPTKLENALKHQGYKWFVARNINLPCAPSTWQGCIIAYRVLVHTLGTAADAVVRFHSYSQEALVEMNGQRGIVRNAGWMDMGHLALLINGGGGTATDFICPPVASNPATFTCGVDSRREAASANVPAPNQPHVVKTTAWYGNPFSLLLESWGPIDYTNPSNQLFFPIGDPITTGNNSSGLIGNMNFDSTYNYLTPYRSADGKMMNFNLYTDRYRNLVTTGCTKVSIDCIPFSMTNVPVGSYAKHGDIVNGKLDLREYDVMSPVTGKSLIAFPN